MNNSKYKDHYFYRGNTKNLFLRLLNREITGSLGSRKARTGVFRHYPSIFMPNKFMNEAIFEKQLFGFGVLPRRFILPLSDDARSKLSHNSVIIGFSKDFTIWCYSLLERHHYAIIPPSDNSDNESNNEIILKSLFSTQLWKPIITREDTINIKSLVDIPLFLIPSSDESLMNHIDQCISELTFFETHVMWNNSNEDLRESFFVFTKSPSLVMNHNVTLLYLRQSKGFSNYQVGHLHISYKSCLNIQGFHPIRNWSKEMEALILNAGSCLYLIYTHIDQSRLKHANGVWEICASSDRNCSYSYSGIEVYSYKSVDNCELVKLHYSVYRFEIEESLPKILREYPQLNLELDDYSMYIIKVLSNCILLYITLVGELKNQYQLTQKSISKYSISFIASLTLESGNIEVLRIFKPVKMAPYQIDSLREDLTQIKKILSQIQFNEVPNYMFYTNKNVLKGVSMPMILHPILPLGICK